MSTGGEFRPPLPDFHVAQQSRRDKLRIPPAPNSLDSLSDLLHVRDTVYGASPPPPTMFNSLSIVDVSDGGRVPFVPLPVTAISLDESGTGGGCGGSLRSSDLQQLLLGGEWAAPLPPTFVPSHQVYYHSGGELHFANQGQELASIIGGHEHVRPAAQPCPWSNGSGREAGVLGGSNLLFLPSSYFFGNDNSRQDLQWPGDCDFVAGKPDEATAFPSVAAVKGPGQGLSLSLSPNPVSKLPRVAAPPFEERFVPGEGSCSGRVSIDPRRGGGGGGPFGPFTGYAAILKGSKFSRPAQMLLKEFCGVITFKIAGKQCEAGGGGDRDLGASSCGGYVAADGRKEGSARQVSSTAVCPSSMNSSTDAGGSGSGSNGACTRNGPEFQQKRATLLYLQDEVCKKYKLYHQQMQMVVSSFDSVSGLSSAAPYTSLALKSVSKHFRSLKNAISDQLQLVSKVLGEEHISSPISSRRGYMTGTHLAQNLRKQKAGDSTMGFISHTQPAWRPQRGLPERAVSVLRSWLFEHFLHPYPTDVDKHMLASRTGLSRNQVSNWFINARVRLWKPMVEEIYTLETKGMSRMSLNAENENRNLAVSRDDRVHRQRPSGDQTVHAACGEPSGCCSLDSMNLEPWQCDKRPRTAEDCGETCPTAMDRDLASFSVYHHQQHAGDRIAGLGAVSLSLGLRHEGGGRQESQHMGMGHLGTTMLHDFVS